MDIGIIGGADGPTTIFLSSDTNLYTIIAVVVLCIIVLGVFIWIKNRRKSWYELLKFFKFITNSKEEEKWRTKEKE